MYSSVCSLLLLIKAYTDFLKSCFILQGVDIDKLLVASRYISEALKRPPSSKVALAKVLSHL